MSDMTRKEKFEELYCIIMVCIKDAKAGEMPNNENAASGAEEIMRCGYDKEDKEKI